MGVERSLLFSTLFERANGAGVQIFENSRIDSVTQNNSKVQIKHNGLNKEFDLLIFVWWN